MIRKLGTWKAGLLALLLVSGNAWAEAGDFDPFQLEAGGTLEVLNNGFDSTLMLLHGRWYLKPVDGQEVLREREFLGHVPYAGIGIGLMEIDIGPADGDGPVYGFDFRYADEKVPVAINADFRTGTLDFSGVDVDVTEMGLSVGYWVQDDFEAGLMYDMMELDSGAFSVEVTTIGVYAKTVQKLGEKAVNLEAQIAQVDYDPNAEENLLIKIGGDYYFNDGISVGGSIAIESGDEPSAEGNRIQVRGTYDRGSMLGVSLSVEKFMASETGVEDSDEFILTVVYRK